MVLSTPFFCGANHKNINDELIDAIIEGQTTQTIQSIIRRGANVNCRTKRKDLGKGSPLHIATCLEQPYATRIINVLLKNGADLESRNMYNLTPLHIAAINDRDDVVPHLISRGADVHATNPDGLTFLHLAVAEDSANVLDMLLHQKNFNVESKTKDEEKNTLLHIAMLYKSFSCFVVLISHDANVNAKDSDGFTPLHLAVTENHIHLMKNLLCNKNTNINAQTASGDTPLHYAVLLRRKEAVETLLEHGADRNIRNNGKETTLDLCIRTIESTYKQEELAALEEIHKMLKTHKRKK